MPPLETPPEDNDGRAAPSPSAPEREDVATPSSGEQDDQMDLFSAMQAALPGEEDAGAPSDPENAAEAEAPREDDPDAEAPDDEIDEGDEENSEDEESEEGAEAEEAPKDEDDGGDLTEAEFKALSQKTQRRMRQLAGEVKDLRPIAQAAVPVFQYMQENEIPMEDLDVVLQLSGAMRKGDWATFLQGVTPYVQLAQQSLGITLPKDLQEQVEQGYVTREHAQELARHRASSAQVQQRAQRDQERLQQENVSLRASQIKSAVNQWEASVRAQDPDYAAKADAVWRYTQALMHEHGRPQTPEQAIQMARAAYTEANKLFGKAAPQKKPTRKTPSSSRQVATGKAPKREPETLEEALKQALRR